MQDITIADAFIGLAVLIAWIGGLLGYTGSMPGEVPNQSEDARQEGTDD